MEILSSIREKINSSPLFLTLIAIFSLILVSLLLIAFVSQITINGVLHWGLFYKVKSFYLILLVCVLIYLYYRFIYFEPPSSENFLDDTYCKAYMRKQCLPELAKKVNDLIRRGETSDEIKNITDDFLT